jgi:hypothetical protein
VATELKHIKNKDISIEKKTLSYSLINNNNNLNLHNTSNGNSPIVSMGKQYINKPVIQQFNQKKNIIANQKEPINLMGTIITSSQNVSQATTPILNFKSPKNLYKPTKIEQIENIDLREKHVISSSQGAIVTGVSFTSKSKGKKLIKK